MKPIELKTDTPEHRAIIRVLISGGHKIIESIHRDTGNPNKEWNRNHSSWLGFDKLEDRLFRLSVPDDWLHESTNEESSVVPECICGFDSDGWRLVKIGEIIPNDCQTLSLEGNWIRRNVCAGVVSIEAEGGRHRTKRHLPDCPCVKKESVSEIAGESMSDRRTLRHDDDCQCVGCVRTPQPAENQSHDGKLDLSEELDFLNRYLALNNYGTSKPSGIIGVIAMITDSVEKLQSHANGGK